MTIWYRAHTFENVREVFSGDGGLFTAGRWSHLGNKVVYCSESIALCTLEWLANKEVSLSGLSYYRYSIKIPDELVVTLSPSKLPENWHATPATDLTRDFAEQHLFTTKKFLALAVPSVLVPEEFNLVINPLHEEFARAVKTINKLGKYTMPAR
jgi:RES domain-containing protein